MRALIAAVLFAPATVHAQTLPGSVDLDDSKLRPAAWEVSMTLQAGDREIVAGTTKHELRLLPGDRWAYITTTTTQVGTAVDTTIARRKSLEPISHRSHAVPRTLYLDYDGRTVTGAHTPRDSAARPIERETELPTFDAAMLEIILGSLPLAAGYSTRLPMYIEERGGLTWFDVRVVGETTVGTYAAWDIEVSVMDYNVRFALATDDHRFLGGRVEYRNGAVMLLTRL